jgi:hypothetical protein
MFELDMVENCYNYLCNNNLHYENIVREVPFLSRCIDLVILTRRHKIITIEFKVKNWRRAIEQAKNHRLGADQSYICLPSKDPSEYLLNTLVLENIGLYLYDPLKSSPMQEYLPAPVNVQRVQIFNTMLFKTVKFISDKPLV